MTENRQGSAARQRSSAGSEALQKFKRGEMSLDEYLDIRADLAIQKLGQRVSDEQRQFLRELIREQLVSDPVLAEYVRRATGRDLGPASIR